MAQGLFKSANGKEKSVKKSTGNAKNVQCRKGRKEENQSSSDVAGMRIG